MQTILVTGAAGFIGSAFVRRVIAHGKCHVVSFDKLTYAGSLDSLGAVMHSERHQFVRGDIGNPALVLQTLERVRPQAIVHFAAESHVDRSIDSPEPFVQTNVLGTCRLLEAARSYWENLQRPAREAFRFLQISTDEVYGSAEPQEWFTEASPLRPSSPYAASKAGADHMARSYFATYGFPVLITNASNNYGPFQFPEKLVPLTIHRATTGKAIPIYGDGRNVRDWLYVDDHCDALHQVLSAGIPGETYNIGGRCLRSNLEVVTSICRLVDRLCPTLIHSPTEQLLSFVADRPGHDRRYAVDSSKITKEFGWNPRTSWERGLVQTVEWYVANRSWTEKMAEHSSTRLPHVELSH